MWHRSFVRPGGDCPRVCAIHSWNLGHLRQSRCLPPILSYYYSRFLRSAADCSLFSTLLIDCFVVRSGGDVMRCTLLVYSMLGRITIPPVCGCGYVENSVDSFGSCFLKVSQFFGTRPDNSN